MTSPSKEPSNRKSQGSRLLRWIRSRENAQRIADESEVIRTTEILLVGGPLDDWVTSVVRMRHEPMPEAIPGHVLGVPFPGAYVPMGITDNGRLAYWWAEDE